MESAFDGKNTFSFSVDDISYDPQQIKSLVSQLLKHQDMQKLLDQSTDVTITSIITVIVALVIQILKIKGYLIENDVANIIQKAKL